MGKGSKTRRRALKSKVRATAPVQIRAEPRQARATINLAPTPEQEAKGAYVRSQGPGKVEYTVNVASDMIGRLRHEGQITPDQEQAARAFQNLRHAYLGELQTRGYGSCLADNMAGYDDGDGSEQITRAYRQVESGLGRVKLACLKLECEKGADGRPYNLPVLRNALDCMGALT